MKKMTILLTLAIISFTLLAQPKYDSAIQRPKNNVNLTAGDVSIISIGYERLIFITPDLFLAGKAGLGYNQELGICLWGNCPPPQDYITVPHYLTANWGKRKSFFEIGLGGSVVFGKTEQNYLFYPVIGYRLQPLKSNKVNFRIYGCYPLSNPDERDILFIPVGASAGIIF